MDSTFARNYDTVIRVGDFVKGYYDGVPTSDGVKSLYTLRPQNRTLPQEGQKLLRSTMKFITSLEEKHYQLGYSDPEKTTLYGIVESVNDFKKRAVVKAWKAKGEILAAGQRFSTTLRLDGLTKVNRTDFFQRCQKPYLERLDQKIRLRGAGFDESAPLSLIAYNNRIVSSLMNRVDTSVSNLHKKTKAGSKHRMESSQIPKAPGALKAMPLPQFAFAIDDPLAEVRAELDSLNAGTKRRKDRSNNVLQSHHDEMLSTGQAQRAETSMTMTFGKSHAGGGGNPGGALSRTDFAMSTKFQATRSTVQHGVSLGTTFLQVQMGLTPVPRMLSASLSGNLLRYRLCGFNDTNGCIYVTQGEGTSEALPTSAFFLGIRLFCSHMDPSLDDVSTAEVLMTILEPSKGVFVGEQHGTRGSRIVLDARVGQSWLQKVLVQEGVACIAVSALEGPKDNDEGVGLSAEQIKDLKETQSTAAANRVGMWRSAKAFNGFLPTPASVSHSPEPPQRTASRAGEQFYQSGDDENEEEEESSMVEDDSMRNDDEFENIEEPLFTLAESTQAFCAQVQPFVEQSV